MAQTFPQRSIAVVREAAWLDSTRAVSYCRILAGVSLVVVLGWIALSHGGLDRTGKPLGTDFLCFWTASRLALSGHPAAAYDAAQDYAAQRAAFGGVDLGYAAFFYPPTYLLVCLPLALLPYFVSLAVWLGTTGYAYWRVVRQFLGGAGAGLAVPVLAFPAVLSNIGHGQNAFLTTALFGGGIILLRTRPILAGICFGALIVKPHLGIFIPVMLATGGRWKTAAAAACSAAGLIGASAALFGVSAWRAFFDALPLAREALERDLIGPQKLQSLFAAVRLWHGSLATAYAAQAVIALAACVLLIVLVRSRPESGAQGPALVAASLLASPYLLDYDLMLLAIPLAWVYSRAQRTGFLPWEKLALVTAFLLPAFSRNLASGVGLPLGPFVILSLLLIVLRRGFQRQA